MELVVFDLDGTLLNNQSQLSELTQHTLVRLQQCGIAYTIATGRTLSSAQELIAGSAFDLPHIYSNGVLTWYPDAQQIVVNNGLESRDARHVVAAIGGEQISPFVTAIEDNGQHSIFHTGTRNKAETQLLERFKQREDVNVFDIENMPDTAQITNISMIGAESYVQQAHQHINTLNHLIAYSGPAVEGEGNQWIDIHHKQANKGDAVTRLRQQLKVSRVICFGDGDNDLSMFAIADESYAMDNAINSLKTVATDTIGNNNDDGVARFLIKRFAL